MDIVNKTVIRAGQARAYQDSVYEFKVETTQGTDAEAWELCQSLCRAIHRKDEIRHDGSCAFPFGLETFGSLKKLKEDGTEWRYCVTSPYCD